MLGLPQAGQVANDFLTKNIAPHGYCQYRKKPDLWGHTWIPVDFYLVVDDFGVKSVGEKHAENLITCIEKYYPVSVDWTGELYCGVILDWDYKHKHVTLYMSKYVEEAMQINMSTKFPHTPRMHRNSGKYKIIGGKSVGRKWDQQTYPLTWKQKIYTKGGRKTSLLYDSSWPHHAGNFRHISSGTFKSNRIHQRSSGPFNWLLNQKPRCQIKIPFQINNIAHTQWCIIIIIITRYKLCSRILFLRNSKFKWHQRIQWSNTHTL